MIAQTYHEAFNNLLIELGIPPTINEEELSFIHKDEQNPIDIKWLSSQDLNASLVVLSISEIIPRLSIDDPFDVPLLLYNIGDEAIHIKNYTNKDSKFKVGDCIQVYAISAKSMVHASSLFPGIEPCHSDKYYYFNTDTLVLRPCSTYYEELLVTYSYVQKDIYSTSCTEKYDVTVDVGYKNYFCRFSTEIQAHPNVALNTYVAMSVGIKMVADGFNEKTHLLKSSNMVCINDSE